MSKDVTIWANVTQPSMCSDVNNGVKQVRGAAVRKTSNAVSGNERYGHSFAHHLRKN